jgi:dihydroxyacid dehydratase/phosphogluconate dehydratase
MRSDKYQSGIERAPHRAVLSALSCDGDDVRSPFIGVVNSFAGNVGGHVHLSTIAEAVRGLLGAPKDGDIISIDVSQARLDVELTQEGIGAALTALPEFEPKVKTGI